MEVRAHWNVSGRPCGSVPEPFSVTTLFLGTVWLGPALAVGAPGAFVVIVTVAGALSTVPSFTINCATYVPARSAVKVGFGIVVLDNVAVLPVGRVIRLHLYVSGSPSTSVDPEPFNCTRAPALTVWFGPAFATGGVFPCTVIVTVDGRLASLPSLTI